ncbi:MAG: hypothetical protein M1813_009519 [Trichoglossum hirsutum]|nr:MAG: hypothetical protein M1813_009519 [Trichoglossum hirsutum]
MTRDKGEDTDIVTPAEGDFSTVLPLKDRYFTLDQYSALQSATALSTPLPLFIYGSLLIPHNLYCATGFHTPMIDLINNTTAGKLFGYSRHALRGASFPAIIPNEADDSFVTGALVLGLNEEEKESVEEFEAGLYDLVEVKVEINIVVGETSSGSLLKTESVRAETYVWNYSEPTVEVVPVKEKEWSIAPLVNGTWSGT